MLTALLKYLSKLLKRSSIMVDNVVYKHSLKTLVLDKDGVDMVEFLAELCNVDNEVFDVDQSMAYLNLIAPDLPDGSYWEIFEAIIEFSRRKSFVGSVMVQEVMKK